MWQTWSLPNALKSIMAFRGSSVVYFYNHDVMKNHEANSLSYGY